MDFDSIMAFVAQHKEAAIAVGVYFLFANLVSTMPSPSKDSGVAYKWAFGFLHGIGAALPRIFPKLRWFSDPSRNAPSYFTNSEQGTKGSIPPTTSSPQ